MRDRKRLNPMALTRGMRERLSTSAGRLEQFDPLGVVDMNLPYPHFYGDVSYTNYGATGSAKVGILSESNTIRYLGDNPLGIRRDYTYAGTISGLSIDTLTLKNVLRDTENFSATYWTATSCSISKNAVGPDGVANSAVSVTASGSPATLVQSRGAVGAGNKRFSVWLRRQSGTGTVEIACNTGSYTTVTVTSEWKRFEAFTTIQVVAGIRITGSSPFQVIEVFAPTASVAQSYYGNAPEIIHSTGSDITFSGNSLNIGSLSTIGSASGTFVFEACTTRQATSDRTWSPFIICEAYSALNDAFVNLAASFEPGNTTMAANISDGIEGDLSTSIDTNRPAIIRGAGFWNSNGLYYSFNGGVAQFLSLDLSSLASAGIYFLGSGTAIRYAAFYDFAVDVQTLPLLSAIKP